MLLVGWDSLNCALQAALYKWGYRKQSEVIAKIKAWKVKSPVYYLWNIVFFFNN